VCVCVCVCLCLSVWDSESFCCWLTVITGKAYLQSVCPGKHTHTHTQIHITSVRVGEEGEEEG